MTLEGDLNVQKADVQSAALSGALTGVQRRCDAHGGGVATHQVSHGEPHEHRGLPFLPSNAHGAAHGLNNSVETRTVTVGALLSEGG